VAEEAGAPRRARRRLGGVQQRERHGAAAGEGRSRLRHRKFCATTHTVTGELAGRGGVVHESDGTRTQWVEDRKKGNRLQWREFVRKPGKL